MNSNDYEDSSAVDCLRKLPEDNIYHDVSLKTSDGLTITANKSLLAAKNPVFHASLSGSFKESLNFEIDVFYKATVVQQLVTYIHTDRLLHKNVEDTTLADTIDLAQLIEAANYYQLPELHKQIQQLSERLIDQNIKTSALYLMYFARMCKRPLQRREALFMDRISKTPELLLDDDPHSIAVLYSLNRKAIELIAKDDRMDADELTMFQIIERWSTSIGVCMGQAYSESEMHNRKKFASKMIKHIDLTKIHPQDIASTVAKSGLVTPERLAEVVKLRATYSASQKEAKYKRRRKNEGTYGCIVTGAGRPDVNGIYHYISDKLESHMKGQKYLMKGRLDGVRGRYIIHRFDYHHGPKRWYIRFVKSYGGDFGDGVDLYNSEIVEGSRLPPTTGWMSCDMSKLDGGLDPGPTLEFL